MQAVLTGDIVNSTQLPVEKERKLLKILQQVLAPNKYEFYRGDSFQVYVKQADQGLLVALLCRTAAISMGQEQSAVSPDARLSIGIGPVINPVKTLRTAKGEAFVLSGRAFDSIVKTKKRLAIAVKNGLANEGLQVIAAYMDAIFETMTGKQAEVIFQLLNGQNQQATASKLKKSKSTIHQHVISSRWNEIEMLLKRYENIISHLS